MVSDLIDSNFQFNLLYTNRETWNKKHKTDIIQIDPM